MAQKGSVLAVQGDRISGDEVRTANSMFGIKLSTLSSQPCRSAHTRTLSGACFLLNSSCVAREDCCEVPAHASAVHGAGIYCPLSSRMCKAHTFDRWWAVIGSSRTVGWTSNEQTLYLGDSRTSSFLLLFLSPHSQSRRRSRWPTQSRPPSGPSASTRCWSTILAYVWREREKCLVSVNRPTRSSP